jgi:alkyl hydroperoxide reductase subunit AhpC
MATIKPEFDRRNVKIIGLSVDPVEDHKKLGERYRGDAGRRTELADDRRP